MTLIESLILGAVQGATEFLPVSSSGHLVLVEALMKVQTPGVLYEVALHLGTLAAVVFFFRRDVRDIIVDWCAGMAEWGWKRRPWREVWAARKDFRMGWYVVVGTLPAGIAGLTVNDLIAGLFKSPLLTAGMLFVTGEILWLTRSYSLARQEGRVTLKDALLIGLAQSVALIPGISRSGSTISAGLMLGLDRAEAARFSFLLFMPAILGAAVLESRHISALPEGQWGVLLAGVLTATITGYIALRFLVRVVKAARLHWFAWYCWGMGIVAVSYFWAVR